MWPPPHKRYLDLSPGQGWAGVGSGLSWALGSGLAPEPGAQCADGEHSVIWKPEWSLRSERKERTAVQRRARGPVSDARSPFVVGSAFVVLCRPRGLEDTPEGRNIAWL